MMSEVCSLFEGLASKGHPEIGSLKAKFTAWWHQLAAEQKKLQESKETLEEKAKKVSDQQEKAKQKALDQLSKLKNHTTAAALKAQEMLETNSKYFKLQHLSEDSGYKIETTISKGNMCSKCRWNESHDSLGVFSVQPRQSFEVLLKQRGTYKEPCSRSRSPKELKCLSGDRG